MERKRGFQRCVFMDERAYNALQRWLNAQGMTFSGLVRRLLYGFMREQNINW